VLFDVQPDQREEVIELVRGQGVEILDEAAVVTMRLSSVKGRSVEELLGSREHRGPRWVLRREYRSTYNDRLRSGEKLVAGTWHERVEPDTEVVPVSLERGIAEDLRVELGDELVFDVQGVPVKTRVASLREVDWRRVQPNFFVVFPRGVLEPAPGFHVLVLRVESPRQSAAMQRAVVNRFPNVSAIDLTLILETMDAVLGKIAFVVRFMALFTVGTGLLVLSAAILAGRFQRIRECVLLRTLGATRRQLRTILVVEYACLGLLASMAAVVLALGAGWALAAFLFEMDFRPPVWPLAVAIATVTVITVVTGWCASRGILNHPPLEVLRAEA
jgi:putative ABC transport system permease protein